MADKTRSFEKPRKRPKLPYGSSIKPLRNNEDLRRLKNALREEQKDE